MTKGRWKCALVGVLSVGLLGGCGNSIDSSKVAVTINGEEVSMGTASTLVRFMQAEMYSYYSSLYSMYGMDLDEFWDQEESETEDDGTVTYHTYGKTFLDSCMDSIENYVLLRQVMGEYGVELTDDDLSEISSVAAEFIAANDSNVLKANGITQESVEEFLQFYKIQNLMSEAMVSDDEKEVDRDDYIQSSLSYIELSKGVYESDDEDEDETEAPETETEKVSTGNDGEIVVGETVLTGAETETETEGTISYEESSNMALDSMNAILEAIQASDDVASADFDEIASSIDDYAYASTCTFSRVYDSENYYSIFDEEVTALLDELDEGEVYSEVLDIDDSYYIIRMDSIEDVDATDSAVESAIEDKAEEVFLDKIEDLKSDAEITINTKEWSKIKVNDTDCYRMKVSTEDEDEYSTDAYEDWEITTEDWELVTEDETGIGIGDVAPVEEATETETEQATEFVTE